MSSLLKTSYTFSKVNEATHKILTLKATTFLVTFVRTIKHFFSPVSLDPKYSSSAGLIRNLRRVSFFKLSIWHTTEKIWPQRKTKYFQPCSYSHYKQFFIKKGVKIKCRNSVVKLRLDSWAQADLAALDFVHLDELWPPAIPRIANRYKQSIQPLHLRVVC